MRPYALVLSNDLAEPEAMLRVIEQTRDYVDGVKIGVTSSMVPGVEIFRRAKDRLGEKAVAAVLADYKVADIGFRGKDKAWAGTNEKIVRNLAQAGTDYITCHTIVGISSIDESVATAHANGAKVLTLPYMTHKGANLFFGMPLDPVQIAHIKGEFQAYGLDFEHNQELWRSLDKVRRVTDLILVIGNHFCVDGYIGPANDPEVLRTYRGFTKNEIWCPGFGRQDQQEL
jgi:orotidine-5'-phosphate decarboxylase